MPQPFEHAGALPRLHERREELVGPAIDIVDREVGEHPPVALAALAERHVERDADRLRHRLRLMWVDDEGTVQFGCFENGLGSAGASTQFFNCATTYY